MSRVLSSRNVGLLLLVLVVSASEPGCMDPAKTILVNRPAVFTRERLVNRRLEEQQFLEGKLKEPIPVGEFQGIQDLRTFTSLYAEMNLSLYPKVGKATSAGEEGVTREELDKRITASQKEAEQRMDQKIQAHTASTASGQAGSRPELPDPNTAAVTRASLLPVERLRDELAYRNAIQAALREQELDDVHDLMGTTIYTLKFDVALAPDRETDAVARVEVAIDNNNPTVGLSDLYEEWLLAFQGQLQREAASLVMKVQSGTLTDQERAQYLSELARAGPRLDRKRLEIVGEATKIEQYAESAIKTAIKTPKEKEDSKGPSGNDSGQSELLKKLSADLAKIMPTLKSTKVSISSTDAQTLRQTSRSLMDAAEALDKKTPKDDAVVENVRGLERNTREWLWLLDVQACADSAEKFLKESSGQVAGPQVQRGLCAAVVARYAEFLGTEGYVSFTDPEDWDRYLFVRPAESGRLYDIMTYAKLEDNFREAIKKLEKGKRCNPYVYSVEPKEQAQNISDVAAVENLKNFVFSIQAMAPGAGMDANGYASYLRRSQRLLHAILRKPLIVGFSTLRPPNKDSVKKAAEKAATEAAEKPAPARAPDLQLASVFGWDFGPRFRIDARGKATFVHTTVQHSVQASVVVPAWWTEMALTVTRSWVGKPGITPVFKKSQTIFLQLPAEYESLTQALLWDRNSTRRPYLEQPRERVGQEPLYYLAAEQADQTLVVHGSGLWRNPLVFAGDQKADGVAVLPDMQGLVAKFSHVFAPPQTADGRAIVDLKVVTSEGTASLRNAVAIMAGPAEPRAQLKSKAIAGEPLVFVIVGPPVRGYDKLTAYVKPAGSGGQDTPFDVQVNDDGTVLTSDKLPDPIKDKDNILSVDLRVTWRPDTEPISLLGGRREKFVYLTDQEKTKINLGDVKVAVGEDSAPTPRLLTFTIPAEPGIFFKYHGIDGKLLVLDVEANGKSLELKVSRIKETLQVEEKELGTLEKMKGSVNESTLKCAARIRDVHSGKYVSDKGTLTITFR